MIINLDPDLDTARGDAKWKIDQAAEQERALYITTGDGQAMVYQRKEAEARAFLDDPLIDPAKIPHIVSEANMQGKTFAEIAQLIIDMADAWMNISALIEGTRLKAKADVESATSLEEIRTAAEVSWPKPQGGG